MSHISRRLRGSRPVVGSSRNRTCGRPDQAGAEVEPAAHAARVGLGRPVGGVGQLEPLEERPRPLARLGGGHVVQPPDHLEVLQAGEVLVDRGVLSREADHVPELLRVADHVEAGDGRAARVGMQQRGQDPDGGGLAGAVGAEEPEDRGGRDLEVDAARAPRPCRTASRAPRRRSRVRSWNRPSYRRARQPVARGGSRRCASARPRARGARADPGAGSRIGRPRTRASAARIRPRSRNGLGHHRRELRRRLPRLRRSRRRSRRTAWRSTAATLWVATEIGPELVGIDVATQQVVADRRPSRTTG